MSSTFIYYTWSLDKLINLTWESTELLHAVPDLNLMAIQVVKIFQCECVGPTDIAIPTAVLPVWLKMATVHSYTSSYVYVNTFKLKLKASPLNSFQTFVFAVFTHRWIN